MLRPDTIGLTAFLGLLTAFGPVATDMYTPSMPEIGRLLAASTAEVQLTLSAYLMGFAIGQVVYGPISDRWGRKPVLLMALALFCLSSLACAAASDHRDIDRRPRAASARRRWSHRAAARGRA